MPSNNSPVAVHGFTLIEVVVALALSGIVVLGAHRLLTQLADEANRITRSAAAADHDGNGDRLLRSLVGQLEPGSDGYPGLAGDEQRVVFTTWCDVPGGWQERCRVAVGFTAADGESALVVLLPDSERVVLRSGFGQGEFRYLTDSRAGGSWVRSWGQRATTPLALGILLDGDTLLVRIGERG